MNGSAMGSVEFDSISQTGCGSRRSPLSATIPGPSSDAGSLIGVHAVSAHHWCVGHRGAAVPFIVAHRARPTPKVGQNRFFAHGGPGQGAWKALKPGPVRLVPAHYDRYAARRATKRPLPTFGRRPKVGRRLRRRNSSTSQARPPPNSPNTPTSIQQSTHFRGFPPQGTITTLPVIPRTLPSVSTQPPTLRRSPCPMQDRATIVS